MAKAKKINEADLKELRTKVLNKDDAVLGTERVMKLLKAKKINKIFLASNCPDSVKEDVHYYAKLAEVPVLELEMNNEELGIFCKKNFFVSVIGTK